MSTAIIAFQFEQREVRVVETDGEPWFVASDVAKILGYRDAANMTRRLDEEDRGTRSMSTPSGDQQMTVISEPGLYAAVLGSKVAGAREFKRWVTHEVLPSLRKHGGYLTERKLEEVLSDPDVLIQLATQLKDERAARLREEKARLAVESYARDLEPRADSYDRFIAGDGTYSVGAAAKMLGLSQNKLFAELRNAHVLIAKGAMANTPYQQYMHHFAVKAHTYDRQDGTSGTSYTTRVQPTGLSFIARKLGLPAPVLPDLQPSMVGQR
ncbi:phage antirepressor [Brachybacterium squillarum]|uniref:phage antirepressor n=1 Tax=Brachybacterium squillarum TaxID=661979 RepID=UPI00222297F1|nr:phage antirepressor [Brachybacterium squillarum]MCW1805277.1 phage antirepressor [Brachybacterium squillarum]